MKCKYVQQLDANDFAFLTRAVFGMRSFDKDSIRIDKTFASTIEVSLVKVTKKLGAAVKEKYSFGYSDFGMPRCYSHIMNTEFVDGKISREFYSYMIRKFGKEYVSDLIQHKYNVYPDVIHTCLGIDKNV